jgi:DNA-binding GntR family transcriptional regulator
MCEARDSDALMLSAHFHVAIAEIAGHAILREFITDLVTRSSLIIALYWSRRDTLCASHAHHPLFDAIAANQSDTAAGLMTVHLVDLLSGLDLAPSEAAPKRLSDILR